MTTKNIFLKRAFPALAIASVSLSSCTFHPPRSPFELCKEFDELPTTAVSGDPPAVVFEEPGTIKVMHGSGRASINTGKPVKVQQSAELPPYANQATVFLNGWHLNYRGGDQHMMSLATLIARIRVETGKITWNALGILCDDGEDEAYDWQYYYTIVAWNDGPLRAMVDHDDADVFCKTGKPNGSDNFFVARNQYMTTALSCFPTFLINPNFTTGRTVAVLPRGVGFVWAGGDHHLLQLAYNLDSSEAFIQHRSYYKGSPFSNSSDGRLDPYPNTPPTARAGGEFVSWNTYAIMKDNRGRRDYYFGEVVSGMGGADVAIIDPPFSILPIEDSGAVSGAGVQSEEVVIENIPYVYAIPMLTGWDIGYAGSNQHVKDLGIWIDEIHYDIPPSGATGTLRYKVSSIVKDNDSSPINYYHHKVTILGLRGANEPRPK